MLTDILRCHGMTLTKQFLCQRRNGDGDKNGDKNRGGKIRSYHE